MIMPESNLLQIMFLGIVEIAFDKIVNFTIHDSLYVACAVVSPVVFYKSIGLVELVDSMSTRQTAPSESPTMPQE